MCPYFIFETFETELKIDHKLDQKRKNLMMNVEFFYKQGFIYGTSKKL